MNLCSPEYWMWLQSSLGCGAVTDETLSYFDNPQKMYEAGAMNWRLSGIFTPAKIESLMSHSPQDYKSVIDECSEKGYKILTPENNIYPAQLKKLSDMPLVLYVWGDESSLNDNVHIAIVGTREASPYGIEVAQRMSFALAKAGVTIVSGGALGIDSEAHAGAMLAKGRTVCVLGCGLSSPYLKSNSSLRRAITRYGAVVSEFPPFTAASKVTFPIRNRLISGLSLGTLVIEAGEKSGSLITARYAAEQGRDVFAVPGDIVRSTFTGTNKLIQDGVKAVFSPSDILSEYEYKFGKYLNTYDADNQFTNAKYIDYRNCGKSTVKAEKRKEPLCEGLTVNARSVYEILSGEALHVDDISEKSGLSVSDTLSALTELELYGYANQIEGKRYIIKQASAR